MRDMNLFQKHRRLTLIITNLVIVLIVDITAGVAYKKIKGYAWYYAWKDGATSERTLRIKSDRYHHDLAKNINTKENSRWGAKSYTVKTNSLGFKDGTNRQVPLKIKKKRLVFIGDSFTEGIGLDYEKTFVGLINNVLKQKYSVLNAGVTSYSPIIYWKKVEDLINTTGLEFDELIVYLDISDIQDEASAYKLNDGWVINAIKGSIGDMNKPSLHSELIKENTILWAWLRALVKREKALGLRRPIFENKEAYTYKDSINRYRSLWTTDNKAYKEYGERGLDISARHMDELLQLLTKHEIKMTLAIYPWPDQVYYDAVDSKQVLFWENWTKKRKVRFINHFNDFFALKDRIGAERLIEEYYIPGDVHFNEKGNILIKEYFLDQYPHNIQTQ